MVTCVSCSDQLRPEWKFCVRCGTPVIPGAIRPEPVELASKPRNTALIGYLIAGALVLVGVAATVAFVTNVLR